MSSGWDLYRFKMPVAFSWQKLPFQLRRNNQFSSKTCVIQATVSDSPAITSNSSNFRWKDFVSLLFHYQSSICRDIEAIDGQQLFSNDEWTLSNSSGRTRVLQNGGIFEKAGVNVSVVEGILSQERANSLVSRGRDDIQAGASYRAAALSFVLHTQSPHLPTLRGDVRVFASGSSVWGGGGADLTIFYVDRPSFKIFHQHWRDVCNKLDTSLYNRFKRQCDDYFYIPSRAEYRGVGGIFYDNMEWAPQELFDFQETVLQNFLPSYQHIINKHGRQPWTADQKRWQRIRRGRYIEFNLLNDRGVRFGLAGAPPWRTDAIMISAPPSVEWPYNFKPTNDSPEEETLNLISGKPIDWANVSIASCN